MAATYEPIATTTLGTAASTITFSSIASTWTDLRLVLSLSGATSNPNLSLRFNNDTTTSYSGFAVYNSAPRTSVSPSYFGANLTYIGLTNGAISTTPALITTDIFSYKGSTYKTILSTESNDMDTVGYLLYACGVWRSTAAVTRLDITTGGAQTMSIGTIATLYGIKAA
jgi:hypothetical protein